MRMTKPARVLLVDDHALVRSGLRVLLEQLPSVEVVAEAGDGREAVRVVEELRPDLVIMDIQMPELNGLDALERIKRNNPSTRLIILSMHANPENVRQALARGADGYLVKAAAQEELEFAVKATIRGDSYLSPAVTRGAVQPAEPTPEPGSLDHPAARDSTTGGGGQFHQDDRAEARD